ncbi:MAG: helix-turn-helix domain-containing protein [Clostridiales bacterium]|jgi:transcriptional regulator with XRE-family HTH domain|nr:helix-turn-helix domain-containing protein [Clostridiales bacterium]
MDYEKFISERISRLRVQKNVSARDMSLTIGQSENYINTIENKRNLPSMTVFFYICEYFDITPRDFFDEEKSNPKLLNDYIAVLKQLKEDEVFDLMNIALKLLKK